MLIRSQIQSLGSVVAMDGMEPCAQSLRSRKEKNVLADESGVDTGVFVVLDIGDISDGDGGRGLSWCTDFGAHVASQHGRQHIGNGIVNIDAIG